MKVRLFFAWYDMWVGVFYDRNKRRIYVFPVPMLGIVVQLRPWQCRHRWEALNLGLDANDYPTIWQCRRCDVETTEPLSLGGGRWL